LDTATSPIGDTNALPQENPQTCSGIGATALVLVSATGNTQQTAKSVTWIEGANVKVNHDTTDQLQNEQACVINPTNPDNVVAICVISALATDVSVLARRLTPVSPGLIRS